MSSCTETKDEQVCGAKYPLCHWGGSRRGFYLASTLGSCPLYPMTGKQVGQLAPESQMAHRTACDPLIDEWLYAYSPPLLPGRQGADRLYRAWRAEQERRRAAKQYFVPENLRLFDLAQVQWLQGEAKRTLDRELTPDEMRDVLAKLGQAEVKARPSAIPDVDSLLARIEASEDVNTLLPNVERYVLSRGEVGDANRLFLQRPVKLDPYQIRQYWKARLPQL